MCRASLAAKVQEFMKAKEELVQETMKLHQSIETYAIPIFSLIDIFKAMLWIQNVFYMLIRIMNRKKKNEN